MKYNIGDRVEHEYLGSATVMKIIRSGLDRSYIVGYVIYTDKQPDVRYNMGERECLVFPEQLKSEKK